MTSVAMVAHRELVHDVEGCAEAIVALLEDSALADEKGRAGRERVRRDFLVPRRARDELRLYVDVCAQSPAEARRSILTES
ncbi:MAG: glycosyltransferase [Actinomycetota bacterium]